MSSLRDYILDLFIRKKVNTHNVKVPFDIAFPPCWYGTNDSRTIATCDN